MLKVYPPFIPYFRSNWAIRVFLCLPLLILCVLFSSCKSQGTQSLERSYPTPGELRNSFMQTRELVIVYGTQDIEFSDKYLQWAKKLQENSSYFKISIQKDIELAKEKIGEAPLLLLGTPNSHSHISTLSQNLPISFSDSAFHFHGKDFDRPGQVFQLSMYPNPVASKMPISLLTATEDATLLDFLHERGTGRIGLGNWPYQIVENGKCILMGAFDAKWQVDTAQIWAFDLPSNPEAETKHFKLFTHLNEQKDFLPVPYVARMEKQVDLIQAFTSHTPAQQKLDVHVYDHPESMGLLMDRMEHSYLDIEKSEVHTLVGPEYAGNIVERENEWVLRQMLGKPKVNVLEQGFAIFFAPKWQKHGYAYWATQLFKSGDKLSLSQIINEEFVEYESPIVRGAMTASLVAFLLKQKGKKAFLELYTSWNPTASDISELEAEWNSFLARQARSHPLIQRAKPPLSFLRGMTFAHEGYQVYNGYGSKLAYQSLEEISRHKANMVAIVPYTGMGNPDKAIPFHLTYGAGGENDASVLYAHYSTKSMGMQTMLKPQVWVPKHWPGAIEMKNEEDWQSFFSHYRRWIRHYALLAEIHEMDVLCIGVEFLKATQAHPKVWRDMIQDFRLLYQGKITYAANWGEEVEKLEFADALDFVGVNCYYPLSDKTDASEQELKQGFHKVALRMEELSKQFQKPIVFTEIGFRSIPHPWVHPHEEPQSDRSTEKDQALSYSVVCAEIEKQSWCKGLIWWKWPSYLSYTSTHSQSFAPTGRPAATIMGKFYGKWEVQPSID